MTLNALNGLKKINRKEPQGFTQSRQGFKQTILNF
jgi:hypothetical protein